MVIRRMKALITLICMTIPLWSALPVFALDVNLTKSRPYVLITVNGKEIRIQRDQDTEHKITGFYAKTSRPCPPFCIHPMRVTLGVETVGEVEIFDFMTSELRRERGVLIDARTPEWYEKRTIPGAVNIPFTVFAQPDPSNPDFLRLMEEMNVKKRNGSSLMDSLKNLFGGNVDTGEWDFRHAKKLLLFCNGSWCDQSPRAIQGLIKIGYPPVKLKYYRGGMNAWEMFGLTTIPGTL